MVRMADRIVEVTGIIRSCALAIVVAGCFGVAGAQPPAQPAGSAPATPPKPATYSGCVQKAPETSGGGLIISTPTACARLAGDVSAEKLAGHQVKLTGELTLRTVSAPALIHVDSVVSVGDSCSSVCTLRPPGTRSLHPPEQNETFGTEGGTPGLVAPPK